MENYDDDDYYTSDMSELFSPDFKFPSIESQKSTSDHSERGHPLPEQPLNRETGPSPLSSAHPEIASKNNNLRDEQINESCRNAIRDWRGDHQRAQQDKERHWVWLTRQDGPTEKETWYTIDFDQLDVQDIESLQPERIEEYKGDDTTAGEIDSCAWDDDADLAFEYAMTFYSNPVEESLETHEQGILNEGDVSHIELDVEGRDAIGQRIRVQRMIEVRLAKEFVNWEGKEAEQTTIQLDRTLILTKPHPFSLPARRAGDKAPHQLILEQLAQHELDIAMDERNHYLRECFAKDVDHVRKRRESTFGTHSWKVRAPLLEVRQADGVVFRLLETRTDAEVDGEVVMTHTITLIQLVPTGNKSRLFALPTEGTELERRIRRARWSISSAIDMCNASGTAEKFVMDKWVDGAYRPKF